MRNKLLAGEFILRGKTFEERNVVSWIAFKAENTRFDHRATEYENVKNKLAWIKV